MASIPSFTLKRIILRELNHGDAPAIYEAFSDEEAMRYRQHPSMQHPDEAVEFIRKTEQLVANEKGIRWGVENIETGKLIGTFLLKRKTKSTVAHIGYSLHREWWNQGLIDEIFAHMLRNYLWDLGIKTLVAKVHKENKVSVAVLEKHGFKHYLTEEVFVAYRHFSPYCR